MNFLKGELIMSHWCPSIFNDIIGPVMIGPSSSHTCGPARIGFLARQLLHHNLKKATVEFARDGAYINMYRGQRSNYGFTSGLLGYRPESYSLHNAFTEAKKRNVEILFQEGDFEATVPNLARLTLESDCGEKVTVYSDSTGGGTVKLLNIDGFDVSVVGDCYEILIFTDNNEDFLAAAIDKLNNIFADNEGFATSSSGEKALINIKRRSNLSPADIAAIKQIGSIEDIKIIEPVLAVLSNKNCNVPFKSGEELLAMSVEEGKEIWELAIDYECARSGWTSDQVIFYMKKMIDIMVSGIHEAMTGNIEMNGIIKPTAGKISEGAKKGHTWIDMGVLNTAVPWSIATMEYSSAMGKVLCAPTGGSAGVIPGAILGIGETLGLSLEEKVKGMLAAAVVGICMAKDYNYSAELYGCQVEPGAASAMAAAGLCYFMGGTVKQSLDAASCALQNILGTICDPVAGLVQVPCISRNAMSTANALVCANIVINGFDPCIPLDESAETMFRVGKQLPPELRCTCMGGLCTTPTGIRLAKEKDERNNNCK
jgi:L-serine dehydratase